MQFVFGDYVLDPDRRELTRGSEAVAVGPQVFDLLLYLVREPRARRQQGRAAGRGVGRADRLRIDPDQPHQCGAQGDRRQRRGAAPDPDGRPQGIPLRRRRQGSPIAGWRRRRRGPSPPHRIEAPAPALALPDKPSIAVLPFQNLSGDPEQEYFADGVVEDIITALSRIRWLFVIARNSSFTYKGRAVDVKQVGRELGVRYVLEGSVRKAGEPGAHHRAAHRRDDRGASLGGPLRRHARRHLRAAGPGRRERRRRDRAAAGAGGDRARQAQADRKPRRLRLLSARHGEPASAEPGRPSTRRCRCSTRRSSSIRISRRPTAMAAWCYFWRKVNGWMTDRAQEIAEGARLARRAVELGRDDAVALTRGGHALAHLAGDLDGGIALARQGAGAQSEPGGRLVPRRLPASLARRTGRRDRAFRARHALEPAGSGNVSDAGRNGDGASVRGALRRRVVMGGEGIQGSAELPDGGRHHRGEPCAGRPDGRSAAGDATHLRQLDPALRISNLRDWLPIHRPEDLATFADGLRKAGLPE